MVTNFIFAWISESSNSAFIYAIVLLLVGIGIVLLLYTIIEPIFGKFYTRELRAPHPVAEKIVLSTPDPFRKIGICVDFSNSDIRSINYALKFGAKDTQFILIHIVESAVARAMDSEVIDIETKRDTDALDSYILQLTRNNVKAERFVGFGQVSDTLPQVVKDHQIELLIMSSHRKGFLHRLIKGTVINKIQRRINIPVFIAK